MKPTREGIESDAEKVASSLEKAVDADVDRDLIKKGYIIGYNSCFTHLSHYIPEEINPRQKVNTDQEDSWRGPDERPEDSIQIWAYTQYDDIHLQLLWHDFKCEILAGAAGWCEWSRVICWCPADPGPMPERFKTVKEKKES